MRLRSCFPHFSSHSHGNARCHRSLDASSPPTAARLSHMTTSNIRPFFRLRAREFFTILSSLSFWMSSRVVAQPAPAVTYDLTAHVVDASVSVVRESPGMRVTWPSSPTEKGEIVFNLEGGPNRPLIERIALGGTAAGTPSYTLMERVDPVTMLTIG